MSKTFSQLLQFNELAVLQTADERRITKKTHPEQPVKKFSPAAEDDKMFKATNIKKIDRKKDRHGYNPGEDAEVYEQVAHRLLALTDMDDDLTEMFDDANEYDMVALGDMVPLSDEAVDLYKTAYDDIQESLDSISDHIEKIETPSSKRDLSFIAGLRSQIHMIETMLLSELMQRAVADN